VSIAELDAPYDLAETDVRLYRDHGYVKLRKVLPRIRLTVYRAEISSEVLELTVKRLPLEQRRLYDRAFLQVTNLWTKSVLVKELVMGKRVAHIAARVDGMPRRAALSRSGALQRNGRRLHAVIRRSVLLAASDGPDGDAWIPLQRAIASHFHALLGREVRRDSRDQFNPTMVHLAGGGGGVMAAPFGTCAVRLLERLRKQRPWSNTADASGVSPLRWRVEWNNIPGQADYLHRFV